MIREGKPVRRDEGARAAIIEAHRRKLYMLQPRFGEFESVLRLDLRRRRKIKQPHTFVRYRYSRETKNDKYDRYPASHGLSCACRLQRDAELPPPGNRIHPSCSAMMLPIQSATLRSKPHQLGSASSQLLNRFVREPRGCSPPTLPKQPH